MTERQRLPRVRIVAALVVALALGACGAGSSSKGTGGGATGTTAGKDAGRIVAASADATTAAKSARMSMTMDMSAQGRSIAFSADGAFDFASRAGDMTMDLSSMGLPGVRGKIEMRIVGGVIYMNMGSMLADAGPSAAQALGGKPWMKLDLSTLGASGASGTGGFGSLGSSDQTSVLDSLRGAGADVQEVGHETVRGVDTTHYRAQIDLTQAAGKLPAAERDRVAESLKALGTGTVPADVWIDAQGRPRKLVMDFDSTVGDAHVGKVTLELFDFGVTVDVQAPPADQTFDLSSMMGGAIGGLLGSGGSNGSSA